jgi:hypothetical protein
MQCNELDINEIVIKIRKEKKKVYPCHAFFFLFFRGELSKVEPHLQLATLSTLNPNPHRSTVKMLPWLMNMIVPCFHGPPILDEALELWMLCNLEAINVAFCSSGTSSIYECSTAFC